MRKEPSKLNIWLARFVKDQPLKAVLSRWGTDKKGLADFLAGRKELPYATLLTLSADTGMSVDELLREYASAALWEVEEPVEWPREYPFRLGYLVATNMRDAYKFSKFDNTIPLLSRGDLDIYADGPMGEICTGIRFDRAAVLEWNPDMEVFRNGLTSLRRGRKWIYVDVCLRSGECHIKHLQRIGDLRVGHA